MGLESNQSRAEINVGVADCEIQFVFDVSGCGAERFEVKEFVVQQMRWDGGPECVQHRRPDVWDLFLKFRDERFDSDSLQIALRTAKVARNDRKLPPRRVLRDVSLRTIGERSNHCIAPVV